MYKHNITCYNCDQFLFIFENEMKELPWRVQLLCEDCLKAKVEGE